MANSIPHSQTQIWQMSFTFSNWHIWVWHPCYSLAKKGNDNKKKSHSFSVDTVRTLFCHFLSSFPSNQTKEEKFFKLSFHFSFFPHVSNEALLFIWTEDMIFTLLFLPIGIPIFVFYSYEIVLYSYEISESPLHLESFFILSSK